MGDFNGTVDQVRISQQRSGRTGSIRMFVWHHQAGTNDDATIGMMVSGSRQVSATVTIDNDDFQGSGRSRITGVVPEQFRPWTSSSVLIDGRALTAEVCNSSGPPAWGIADETFEACAIKAVDAYIHHDVPLKRVTSIYDPTGHIGHGELLGMFNEGYATACPGNLDIDRILARAKQIIEGTYPDIGGALEDSMTAAGEAQIIAGINQLLANQASISEQVKDIQGSIYFTISDSESPRAVWAARGNFRLWIEDPAAFQRMGAPERVNALLSTDPNALLPIMPGTPRPPSYVQFTDVSAEAIYAVYGGEVKVHLAPEEWGRIYNKVSAANGGVPWGPEQITSADPRWTLRQVDLFLTEGDATGKVYAVDKDGKEKHHVTYARYMELARPVYLTVPATHPYALLPEGAAF